MTQDAIRWIGKTQTSVDTLSKEQAALTQSVLQTAYPLQEAGVLPPLWHWVYFLTALPASELGRDGHPKAGGFMPPLDLPRRMWAGGRFWFKRPLKIGIAATKTSKIQDIKFKSGKTGPLCFITIRHELAQNGKTCLTEEQDLVFREDPKPNAKDFTTKAPSNPDFSNPYQPEAITLFRYSALTFNGHRIHYDRQYCKDVEGYPDLVVHGPLIGTLLAQAASDNGRQMSFFSFTAKHPAYVGDTIFIEGSISSNRFWARSQNGTLLMEAEAEFLKDE